MKKEPLKTALVGGSTVKTDSRIRFFGEVDTLSSFIMELTYYVNNDELSEELKGIVKKLSLIMSVVAGYKANFDETDIQEILDYITKYKTSGPVLKEFVLPGQNLVSAKIHVVRTIARKCELAYATVYSEYGGSDAIFEYLNKLSTLFYELALFYEKKN